MSATQRIRLVDEVIRRLAAALRAITLYAPGHPLVERSINSFAEVLNIMHSSSPSVTIGIVGDDLVVQDTPIPRAAENMEQAGSAVPPGRHRADRHRPGRGRRAS